MLTNVNILAGQSRYDVFELWQEALCQAFGRLGIRAQVISGGRDASLPPAPGTLSIGFNLVRNWCALNRQKLHFAWLVDHPAFHAPFFDPTLTTPHLPVNHDRCLIGNVDQRWVEFAKSFYGFPGVHFMPHAGIAAPRAPDDWSKRELDVVFFGTVDHPDRRRAAVLEQAGVLKPVLEALFANFSLDTGRSLDETFLELLLRCQLPPQVTRSAFNRFLPMLTGCFLHAGQRLRVLRAIKSHEVHVFGAGPWPELNLPSNIIVHDAVTYRETLDILGRARLLINHSPLMHWGGHERICDALLCGCRVLSSFSNFIQAEFGATGGVVLHANDVAGIAGLDGMLDGLLNDPDAPARIAAAQRIVLERHMMLNRAAAIRDLAQARWPGG